MYSVIHRSNASLSPLKGWPRAFMTVAMHVVDRRSILRLSRRSNVRGFRQLGIHISLLALTSICLWKGRGSYWLPPLLVLHGIVLNFLFCAQHETTHRTA